MSTSTTIQFLTNLKSLFPQQYTGIGYETYKNYINQLNINTDKVNADYFTDVVSFLCLTIEIVAILNRLGLTGDSIQQKNYQSQKVTTKRVLYSDEFPPEKYAYAPVKSEVRTTIYYDTSDGITSNEIEANKIITALYGIEFPQQVKEVQVSVSDYDIIPPVAILKNESSSRIQTLLIAPNMDTNWMSIHQFSKFIYYTLSSFQPAVLEHALAFFFIKNHTYEESLILNALSSAQAFIATLLGNLKISDNDKEFMINAFTFMYDLITGVSNLLNGVVSSIANVTGNKSRVDPKNTLMLLASVLRNNSIIEMLQNDKDNYQKLQNSLPCGKVVDTITQSTHTSYTPQGEQTIVSEKTVQLTTHGQRCSYTNVKKISRNSVIQVIPLLRSKIVAKDGNMIKVEVKEHGQAQLLDKVNLGITDTKKVVISLPTTSWDDAIKISSTFEGRKYITETVSFKICIDSLSELLNIVSKFNTVSFSYSSNSKTATLRIFNRGFESSSTT